ncbi:hypothetical protein [Cysteiniphilum litorale]|uniref:hypothetical protein n=1 Tax=Cysteiniphilum litorale TaxID=2056700 RepID=UPI003F8834E2
MSKSRTIVRVFCFYFVVYALIGALSAWIPFMMFGIMLGGVSVTIAAITMAILRTIDFVNDKKSRIGIKKYLIAIGILLVIDCLFSFITMYWM